MKIAKKRTLEAVKEITSKVYDKYGKSQQVTQVYGTGKSKHLPIGKKASVGLADAELLIKQGKASKEPVQAEKKAVVADKKE